MTNDKTVTMPRELAERMLRNGLWPTEADELRALLAKSDLAAPVFERQPEPSLWLVRIPEEPEDPEESPAEYVHAGSTYELSNLLKRPGATIDQVYYASPPAPVAVVLPERLLEILKFLDGSGTLNGWSFGSDHSSGRKFWWRAELRACLDKVKELNQ